MANEHTKNSNNQTRRRFAHDDEYVYTLATQKYIGHLGDSHNDN